MMHIKDIKNRIAFLIILALVISYTFTIYLYTSHMPIADDYSAILSFLNEYVETPSISQKITMIFSQFNEHRITFNRIVEILQFYITGEVNFFYLTIIGNAGWFFCIFLLWKYFKENHFGNLFAFVPIVLIMLSFSHSALMTWPMASLQNYWQLFFALVSIYFVTNDKFWQSTVFMLLSFFTGGGGIVLIPLIILYCIIQKSWKRVFYSVMIGIFVLWIYFILLHYQSQGISKDIINIVFLHYDQFLTYCIIFIGNIGDTKLLSILFGILLLFLFLFKGVTITKKNPFIAYSLFFIIMIALLAGLSRSESGFRQAMSSRYAIYSTLFFVLIYMQYLSVHKNKKLIIYLGYIFGILLFIYYMIVAIPALKERKFRAETTLDLLQTKSAETILKQAKASKVFYSWEEVKLPSELLNVEKVNGKNNYSLVIDNTMYTSKSKKNRAVLVHPGQIQLHIHGFIDNIIGESNICAIVLSLDTKKEIYFSGTSDRFYLDTKFDVFSLSEGRHVLEVRTINESCDAYVETVEVPIIKENNDTLFKLPFIKKTLKGWIDKFTTVNDKIYVSGWYAKIDLPVLSKILLLEIDGKKFITRYGYGRPDVSKVLGNDAYNHAGFKLILDKKKIGVGKHIVKVYILSDDLKKLYQDTKVYEFSTK